MEYLVYMETRIGQKTLTNQIFSLDDVTEAFVKCTEHFDDIGNPKPIGKGRERVTQRGSRKTLIRKTIYINRASLNTTGTG